MSERAIWISAALLGLAVAVGLAILTSHVSQPPVGVPGEPVSAGQQLAPARSADRDARTAGTVAAPPVAAVPEPADEDDDSSGTGSSGSGGDDDSGRGRGRGRGRGGDD